MSPQEEIRRLPDNPLRSFIWMISSGIAFSLASVFVKRLSISQVPQFEIVFFRGFVNFIIELGIVLALGLSLWPRGTPLLIFRGIAGFGAIACGFYTIGILPVSIAVLLNYLAPVFVVFLARIFLKEKLSYLHLGSIGLALVGLTLILRLNPSTFQTEFPTIGIVSGLLASVFGSLAVLAVRAATARVSIHQILLYLTAVVSLFSLPGAVHSWVMPTSQQWIDLVSLGLVSALAQYSMTEAYRHANAGIVSTMALMGPAFSVVWGWSFFNEEITWVQGLGMVLVGAGLMGVTLKLGRVASFGHKSSSPG